MRKNSLRLLFLVMMVFQFGFLSLDSKAGKSLDLEHIKRISRASFRVQHQYYDKSRIKPREMLEEGLYELAKEVPEILPKFTERVLYLQLGAQSTPINIEGVKQYYDILAPLSQVFGFIATHYKGDTKLEDMEYAFIAGMLSVLDPHSQVLPPKVYEEFMTHATGQYGGLGIAIGFSEDRVLKILSPIEDTPAYRAGLLADDLILQIDDQATVNMTLEEAVELMRGAPNTKVRLKIKTITQPKTETIPEKSTTRYVTLKREVIQIASVQYKLLKKNNKNIGVIRLKEFQETAFEDMIKSLQKLQNEIGTELDGIVLDMRDNPGGLLDQALMISDLFLKEGEIVYTVGADDNSTDVEYASRQAKDIDIPVAVVINDGSASASEIVAGALRNNDRALVIGERSFGKGSVQQLYDLGEGASLKLTISQYLTPGKQSIQAVGIPPDINVYPSVIREDAIDLRQNRFGTEQELSFHLENQKYIKDSNSFYNMTYLNTEKPKIEYRYTSQIHDEGDYLLGLAAKILAEAGDKSKQKMLEKALPLLDKESQIQDGLITKELKKYSVDWSQGQKSELVKVKHSYQFFDSEGHELSELPANTDVELRVTLQNQGPTTLHRVLGEIEAFNPLINHKELVFGKMAAGDEKMAEINFKVPAEIINFKEEAKFLIYTEKSDEPTEKMIATHIKEKVPPSFAYSYKVFDGGEPNTEGNKNGIPEAGEKIGLRVTLKNLGPGESAVTVVNLKNTEGKHVFLDKAKASLGNLGPGEEKTEVLYFDVQASFQKDEFSIDFFALDDVTKTVISDTLKFALKKEGPQIEPPFNEVQSPPLIVLSDASQKKGDTYRVVAEITDDQDMKDVSIFVKGKKHFYLNLEGTDSVKKKKIDLEMPLEEGLNSILLQVRDARNLMSQKNISIVHHDPMEKNKLGKK